MKKKNTNQENMKKAAYDMLYLTACGINEIAPTQEKVAQMNLQQVYAMSKFHNLTAITQMALEHGSFAGWQESKNKAIRKNLLLDTARAEVLAFLEQSGIWYLPLKGIILQKMYPKLGMRQMADNDILFDVAYQQEVCDWFTAHGYTAESIGQGNHDVYQKRPVLNFEMHTALFGNGHNPEWIEYYSHVKDRLFLDKDKSYGYHFSDEDFY